MAKRFTETDKYKKPFIRGLKGAYKLLWDYINHDCDHAGVWIVDFEIAQILLGDDVPVNKKDALKCFNTGEIRIIEVDDGKRWFIIPFIIEQYGKLVPGNRVHDSVLSIIDSYKVREIYKGLISPLQGAKDKDKDKVKDKDQEKEEILKEETPEEREAWRIENDKKVKKFFKMDEYAEPEHKSSLPPEFEEI